MDLANGQIAVIEQFDGEDTVDICYFDDERHTNRQSLSKLLPEIRFVAALARQRD